MYRYLKPELDELAAASRHRQRLRLEIEGRVFRAAAIAAVNGQLGGRVGLGSRTPEPAGRADR
jgi:hypothetical protein